MKRLFMVVALTLALSGAALGGDVPSTDQPAPPPPPTPIRSGAALAGDVPSTDQPAPLLNPMVSIILTVISAVS